MTDQVSEIDRQGAGIGGWLIIPAIICVIAPLRFSYGGIEAFTNAARVSSQFRSVVYLDGMLAFILALAWVGCAYLMFTSDKRLPKVFAALMAAGVGKVLLATFLLAANGGNVGPMGADFAAALVPAAIWIPYMLVSKRVKRTFTRA